MTLCLKMTASQLEEENPKPHSKYLFHPGIHGAAPKALKKGPEPQHLLPSSFHDTETRVPAATCPPSASSARMADFTAKVTEQELRGQA